MSNQTTSLTPEALALLRECLENGGRIRSTLEQKHAQVTVFELRDLGLLEWAFADGWHLTPAGKLVAELLEALEEAKRTVCLGHPVIVALVTENERLHAELLASRTYSPSSEDLPAGEYVVIPEEGQELEVWNWDLGFWLDEGDESADPPFRVLGSALPPYSAQGNE